MQDFIQHLLNGVSLGSIYALIALGYTMVYGILQMINFAHSDVYMFGAFVAYYISKWTGLQNNPGLFSFTILIFSAVIGCALLGYFIEKLAYKPLRNAPKSNILITAIGVSLLLQYSGQVIFGADPKLFPTTIENITLITFGQISIHSFEVTVLTVSLLSMLLLHFLIHKTKTGKAMRAVSSNPQVATLLGVNTHKMISATFALGSALAGVGSVLVGMSYPKIDPLMGTMIGLKAFVAAVLGGIGSLPGAVLGGLIMGLSEEMVVSYFSSTYRDALAFGILIVILIIKPSGLLGKYKQEKV